MRCLHVALIGLLFLVIVGALVVIWFFEGPDEGGYDQIKRPAVDHGISNFLGSYLPLMLLPFLLFFVLLICYLRLRAQKQSERDVVGLMMGEPVAPPGGPPAGPPFPEPNSADVRESAARPPPPPPQPNVEAPAPMPSAPVRGGGSPTHHHHSRPIPPLPEFHEVPAIPSRQGLPSYDAVYHQLGSSPVPPGTKKASPSRQLLQQQQQQQQAMQHPLQLQEGSLSVTPVFDRVGMKPAHSATSISRGRVSRAANVNKESKESAL